MKIVLREKVVGLGHVGAVVNVRAGYGRNYLIPYGMALQATPKNLAIFEALRAEWEEKHAEKLRQSQDRAVQLKAAVIEISAKASEEGKLFGSVTARDVAEAAGKIGIVLEKNELLFPDGPIRALGDHDIAVLLHGDIRTTLKVCIIAEK